jgi:hypothetical protein
MRWYIDEYDMGRLATGVKRLDKSGACNIKSTASYSTIISERDGLFVTDSEETLYALRHESKFTRFLFNDFSFICQHSEPIKEEVFSQTPMNCKCIATCLVKYEVTHVEKQNCVLLCIEYSDDVLTDFYFDVLLPTTNTSLLELITLSKKEINVFLSLLNNIA